MTFWLHEYTYCINMAGKCMFTFCTNRSSRYPWDGHKVGNDPVIVRQCSYVRIGSSTAVEIWLRRKCLCTFQVCAHCTALRTSDINHFLFPCILQMSILFECNGIYILTIYIDLPDSPALGKHCWSHPHWCNLWSHRWLWKDSWRMSHPLWSHMDCKHGPNKLLFRILVKTQILQLYKQRNVNMHWSPV